ncbi:hypothetical protein BKA81DRAFT_406668 [Phyllosticta paracitricarpa]|uniref:Ubiquitin-like protease family profile domain-containing protein n=2 Tax=Phyllosticta TaxID=121621 RepID=A0ABR1M6E6_9PEZI
MSDLPVVTAPITDDLLFRAILSVTEAISQSDSNDDEFSLYNVNLGPSYVRILRSGKPLLLPWPRDVKGERQMLLVHARYVETQDGQEVTSDENSATARVQIDFYVISNSKPGENEMSQMEDYITNFLRDENWFDASQNSGPTFKWFLACRGDDIVRNFAVAYIAIALALGLKPTLGKLAWNDQQKGYAQDGITYAVEGGMTPAHFLSLFHYWNFVENPPPANPNWGQNFFDYTKDLRDQSHFDGVWEEVSDELQRQQEEQQQQQQQPGCTECNVAGHCLGDSGTGHGHECSRCPIPDHCLPCAACPITSHCIPDITQEAEQGDSYLWSIHAFRSEYAQARRRAETAIPGTTVPRASLFGIRSGMGLFEDAVVTAIMAVTEAISVNGRGHTFSMFGDEVYSTANLDAASRRESGIEEPTGEPNINTDVVRQRRDLILPIMSSDPTTPGAIGHIWLAVVQAIAEDAYRVDVYDSQGGTTVSTATETFVQNFVRRTQWWSNDPYDYERPQELFFQRTAAKQTQGTLNCGIHTILNAWSVALGLPLNPTPHLDRLHHAIEATTYAAYGIIDCKTICQLLHHLAWVQPGSAPPADRHFKRTVFLPAPQIINGYHDNLWNEEGLFLALGSREVETLEDCVSCQVQAHCHHPDGSLRPVNVGAVAQLAAEEEEEEEEESGEKGVQRVDWWGGKRRRSETTEGTEHARRKRRRT